MVSGRIRESLGLYESGAHRERSEVYKKPEFSNRAYSTGNLDDFPFQRLLRIGLVIQSSCWIPASYILTVRMLA